MHTKMMMTLMLLTAKIVLSPGALKALGDTAAKHAKTDEECKDEDDPNMIAWIEDENALERDDECIDKCAATKGCAVVDPKKISHTVGDPHLQTFQSKRFDDNQSDGCRLFFDWCGFKMQTRQLRGQVNGNATITHLDFKVDDKYYVWSRGVTPKGPDEKAPKGLSLYDEDAQAYNLCKVGENTDACSGVTITMNGNRSQLTFDDYPCICVEVIANPIYLDAFVKFDTGADTPADVAAVMGQANSQSQNPKAMAKPKAAKNLCATLEKCCAPHKEIGPAEYKGCTIDHKEACCDEDDAEADSCCDPPPKATKLDPEENEEADLKAVELKVPELQKAEKNGKVNKKLVEEAEEIEKEEKKIADDENEKITIKNVKKEENEMKVALKKDRAKVTKLETEVEKLEEQKATRPDKETKIEMKEAKVKKELKATEMKVEKEDEKVEKGKTTMEVEKTASKEKGFELGKKVNNFSAQLKKIKNEIASAKSVEKKTELKKQEAELKVELKKAEKEKAEFGFNFNAEKNETGATAKITAEKDLVKAEKEVSEINMKMEELQNFKMDGASKEKLAQIEEEKASLKKQKMTAEKKVEELKAQVDFKGAGDAENDANGKLEMKSVWGGIQEKQSAVKEKVESANKLVAEVGKTVEGNAEMKKEFDAVANYMSDAYAKVEELENKTKGVNIEDFSPESKRKVLKVKDGEDEPWGAAVNWKNFRFTRVDDGKQFAGLGVKVGDKLLSVDGHSTLANPERTKALLIKGKECDIIVDGTDALKGEDEEGKTDAEPDGELQQVEEHIDAAADVLKKIGEKVESVSASDKLDDGAKEKIKEIKDIVKHAEEEVADIRDKTQDVKKMKNELTAVDDEEDPRLKAVEKEIADEKKLVKEKKEHLKNEIAKLPDAEKGGCDENKDNEFKIANEELQMDDADLENKIKLRTRVYVAMGIPKECEGEEALEFICRPAAEALKGDLNECDVNEPKDRLELTLEFENQETAIMKIGSAESKTAIKNAATGVCKPVTDINLFKMVQTAKDEDSDEEDDERRVEENRMRLFRMPFFNAPIEEVAYEMSI